MKSHLYAIFFALFLAHNMCYAQNESRKIISDLGSHTDASGYSAHAVPWCSFNNPELIVGKDLINTIYLLPSRFPSSTSILSVAPMHSPENHKCGVYGYHFVAYGNYDNGTIPSPVIPRKVKDIRMLSLNVDVDFGGDGQFNILNEFYLTSMANDLTTKILEVGLFFHASIAANEHKKKSQFLGLLYDEKKQEWEVFKAGSFVMFFPRKKDHSYSQKINFLPFFDFLEKNLLISGKEWFNGMAIGVEPVTGKSYLNLKKWEIAYE